MIRNINEAKAASILTMAKTVELGELITGRIAGRGSRDAITLYESHGMGSQDIYTGHYILEVARQRGIGIDLPVGD